MSKPCDFCETRLFHTMDIRGEGIGTMSDNIQTLFGRSGYTGSGVQLKELNGEPVLSYDNSSNEYGDGYLPIRYCPMCGRKLKEEPDDA